MLVIKFCDEEANKGFHFFCHSFTFPSTYQVMGVGCLMP